MSATATPNAGHVTIDTDRPGIPFTRLVTIELRKMFDTRSGFWLMSSIGIVALLASIGVILFVPDDSLSYLLFAGAIGFPLGILLPIVAILSVTSEWSQRTGLATFTLAPHRGWVIASKAAASVVAGAVGAVVALAIGALGNLLGAALNGIDPVWDLDARLFGLIIFGNVLGLLIGFMLGTLIRNSAGAIVAYFVYSFAVPSIFAALYALTDWFKDIQPWIDFNSAQGVLFEDTPTGEQWAHLGTSGLIWFVVPMIVGVWMILRSEVK